MIDFDKKLKKEYLNTEKRNAKWCHNISYCLARHKNLLLTLYMLNPFNKNNYARSLRWDSIRYYNLVQNLTLEDVSYEEKYDILDMYIKDGVIETYEEDKENDIFYVTTRDGSVIDIKKISDYIDDEKLKNKLLSKERMGNCHAGSMNLSHIFDEDAEIVIGFCKLYNNIFCSV